MTVTNRGSNFTFVGIFALLFTINAFLMTPDVYAGSSGDSSMQGTAGTSAKGTGDAKPPKAAADKSSDKHKRLGFCGPHMPVRRFVVDASGAVSDTGRTFEGPACIEVFYNPIQSYVSLATNTTTVNGPDLSKATTGGSSQGAVAPLPKLPEPKNLVQDFALLKKREEHAKDRLKDTENSFITASGDQDKAISEISLLRRTTKLRSPSQVIDQVKEGYKGLKSDLHTAMTDIAQYFPTDRPGANGDPPVLAELQDISDRLARLPLIYFELPAGTKKSDLQQLACELDLKPVPGQNKLDFDPATNDMQKFSWTDWSGKCKAAYDQLKTIVDSDIQEAKMYTDGSDNTKGLKSKIAIVQYWDALFKDLGLRTDMTVKQIDDQDISGSFYAYTGVKCGILFNQTANTAVNIVAADLTPTLEGKDPDIKAQGAFVTVSCGTPFSISAGVGFSTIHQQEFAIVKSAGTATTSVNTFGVVSDSRVTPMPMVMTSVRLGDWQHHKYAFHGSFGISGNLQNSASGGSAAEFLPAGTLSFWRTMYVSVGPQIGTKSELAGGFSVGQQVPSDITTINGQVKRTRTVGFGFAITFTKP